MNDNRDPIDRELQELLAVRPSTGFESRILTRISEAEIRPNRRLWFEIAAGVVTAAIVVVVIIGPYREMQAPASSGTAAVPDILEPVPRIPPRPVSPHRNQTEPPARQSAPPVTRPAVAAYTFEPGEAGGRLEAKPIELAPLRQLEIEESIPPLPVMNLPPMAKLEPITIEPFSLSAPETGVLQ